jgi:hypothetical protein
MSVRRFDSIPGLCLPDFGDEAVLTDPTGAGTRTPMRRWGGEVPDRHVRFGFSRGPVSRRAALGAGVRAALGSRAR